MMALMPTALAETTFTELLRNAGEVSDRAEAQDIRLVRRNQPDLFLGSYEREAGLREVFRTMALLLRSLMKREGVEISDLLRDDLLTAASWTEFLPEAERVQFVEEITRLAVASVESGVLTPVVQAWREWQATAAIHADPRLAAGLNLPPSKAQKPVPRP
jgi:hypothetical protein